MATPQPPRGTPQNVASMAQKATPGLRSGSRAGLGPVQRAAESATAPALAGADMAWDGDNTYIISLDDVTVGPSTIYDYVFEGAYSVDDSLATVSFLNSTLNFTAAGMYQFYFEVTADGSAETEPAGFSYLDTYLQLGMSLTGAGHTEFKDQRMVTAFAGFHGETGIRPQAWNVSIASDVTFTGGILYVQRVVYPT